jgi:hypothetical protein
MTTITYELIFTDKDILNYAEVSGDHNPIHTSKCDAEKMGFESCPIQGMLVMARVGSYCRMSSGESKLLKEFIVRFQAPVYPEYKYVLELIPIKESVLHFTLSYSTNQKLVMKGKARLTLR